MREIDFAGKKLAIKSAPWSLVVYEDQFGRDMSMDFQDMSVELAHSARVDMAAFTRILWCLARTADSSLPDYDAWMKSLPDDALDGIATDRSDSGIWGQVQLDYMQAFFRSALGSAEARSKRGQTNSKTTSRSNVVAGVKHGPKRP
jgi:hypothetical protein